MSNLILTWLNEDVKLSRKIYRFDQDFSNGYLFGDLLNKLGLPVEGLKDSNDPNAMVKNFSRLSTILMRLRIKLTPTDANEIMSMAAGAAMRLVYQIKMEMTRRQKIAMSQSTPRKEARTRLNKATVSGDMQKLYGRKDQYERMQKKFFETQLTHTIHAQTKHERMEQHLKRFADFKTRSEKHSQRVVDSLYRIEKQEIAENRHRRLETMRRKQEFEKKWEGEGIARWKENQRLARIRRQGDLGFEMTVKEKGRRKREATRLRDTMEVRSCIDEFERNLDRIGVQDDSDEGNTNEAHEEQNSEEIDSLMGMREKMRRTLPDPRVLEMKAVQNLQDIRMRKQAARVARKERTRRRRKVLADQQASTDATELSERQKFLLDTLLVDCKRKRDVAHETWRMRQMKSIMKENARFRMRQLIEARERERVEAEERGRVAYLAAREKQEEESKLLIRRFEETMDQKSKAKKAHVASYCNKLARNIVDISIKAAAYRGLSLSEGGSAEDALIPRDMWKQWTTLFVNLKPVLPATGAIESDAGALLSKEGGMSEADLTAAISINDRINETASLLSISDGGSVLEAELNRYLAGEGKWTATTETLQAIADVLASEDEPADEGKKGGKGEPEEKTGIDVKALHRKAAAMDPGFLDEGFGAILAKVAGIVYKADQQEKTLPVVPKLPLTVCLLGKPYAGKKTQAEILQSRYGLEPLDIKLLIEEAIGSIPKEGEEPPAEEEKKILVDLGERAKASLGEGQALDDELSVDLVIAAVNRVKKKLSEGDAKIGGWCLIDFPSTKAQAELLEKKLTGFDLEEQKGAPKSKAAPPANEEPRDLENNPYPSGIDLVFRLDASHPTLLARAIGQLVDSKTGEVYHALSRPPPDDAELKQRLAPPEDHDQLASKLAGQVVTFGENETSIEEWFRMFGAFKPVKVDSRNQPLGQSSDFVADSIGQTVEALLEKRRVAEAKSKQSEEEAAKTAEDAKIAKEAGEDSKFENEKAKIETAVEEEEEKEGKEEEGKEEEKKEEKEEGHYDDRAVSTQIDDYNLEANIAKTLSQGWSKVEILYQQRFRNVLRGLQAQRIAQVKHCAKSRENFREYLRRSANEKVWRVEEFQDDFNCIHMDLRNDPEAKAELHQRVDELADELWGYTQRRKNEDVTEYNEILSQGWLEKQAYLIMIYCATIMQLEAQRYLGSVQTAKDFFLQCLGNPPQAKSEEGEEVGEKGVNLSILHDATLAPGAAEEGTDDAKAKGKGKAPAKEEGEEGEEVKAKEPSFEYDYRTPLRKAMEDVLKLLVAPNSPDLALKPAEGEGEPVKGGKGGKGKGGVDDPVEESAAQVELKKNIKLATDLAQGHLAGIVEAENLLLTIRLRRVFMHCVSLVEDIKSVLFNQEFPCLKRDIASRIKGESGAIDTLASVIRVAIEEANPVYERLYLEGENMYIDEKHVVVPMPEKPKTSIFDFSDASQRARFSVPQLKSLAGHFRRNFPDGFVPIEEGSSMFLTMAKTAYSAGPGEGLPAAWCEYSKPKFAAIIEAFADHETLKAADWREIVVRLSLAVKIIPPSTKQLETLAKGFLAQDGNKTGLLDSKQFSSTLKNSAVLQSLCGTNKKKVEELVDLYFDIFSKDGKVHYPSFLLYLSFEPAQGGGITKALSLALLASPSAEASDLLKMVLFRGSPGTGRGFSGGYKTLVGKFLEAVEGVGREGLVEAVEKDKALSRCELYKLKTY